MMTLYNYYNPLEQKDNGSPLAAGQSVKHDLYTELRDAQ
jgi:hypothetical protein